MVSDGEPVIIPQGKRWLTLGCWAALLAACSPSQQQPIAACLPSPFRSARTLIIAHASGDWFGPPNSIEMLAGSLKAGADLIDLDIRVTADGALVGAHDDQLANQKISQTTLAELRRVDLRDTWANPGRRSLVTPVRIATVDEVLAAFPTQRLSLEFKTTGGEQALCDILDRTGRAGDVYVSSAGDAAVDRFKQVCPRVATTVTDAMVPVMFAARENNQPWCASVPIGQPPLSAGSGDTAFRLNAEGVRWEQAHGLAVYTWTADDDSSLQYVKTLGVDAVYTARADRAKAILNPDQ